MTLKHKILIVDDEEFNLEIIESDLSDAGFETVCVTNGASALQMLEDVPDITLILLDRMMPGLDGIEVLKKIKSLPHVSGIPVIMQSADGRNQQIVEGLNAGACTYLIKPYDEKQLVNAVTSALQLEA